MSLQSQVGVSLYDLALQEAGNTTSVMQCTKATLVHISHTIEDVVLKNRLPAMMFTGFQESSHWRKETKRYSELMDVAQQVCIFAGKPLPEKSLAKALQVKLEKNDPLRQEWFVIILSKEFIALITGKDNLVEDVDDALRQFDTILSFSPHIINRVLDALEGVLEHYRPDILPALHEARETYNPLQPDMDLITTVVSDLVRFEERLINQLNHTRAEQQIMNEQLRDERDFTRLLINATPSYIVTTSLDGQTVMMNPTLQNMIGDASVTDNVFWEAYVPDDDHAMFRDALHDLDGTRFQTVMYTKFGEAQVEWVATPIPNEQPRYMMWFGLDITDKIRAEQLRREEHKLQLQLENERILGELREKFMITISHEFRTPLATILSSSEMLERYYDRLDEEARDKRFARIKRQVYLLTEMISDMTAILEVNEGMVDFKPVNTNILHLCEAIVLDVKLVTSSQQVLVLENQLNEPDFKADGWLITHILLNLLSNAIKYSPDETPVTLTVAQSAKFLIFIVVDEGIGIPDDDQSRIYDAFYRGSNVTDVSGAGLGLKLVYDCVKLYNGRITFDTSSEGTQFTVRLPILKMR